MIRLTGTVRCGLGNASSNFKQGEVEPTVASLLGTDCVVPGTLNLEIEQEFKDIDDGRYDRELNACDYNGTEWVKIKRCKVNGIRCAIVRPLDHFNVEKFRCRIEIMSSVKLRDRLGLSDGSEVTIQLQGDNDWWNKTHVDPPTGGGR
jgi:CTP-dependent riboflavin kinase